MRNCYIINVNDTKQGVVYPDFYGPFTKAEVEEVLAEGHPVRTMLDAWNRSHLDWEGGYAMWHSIEPDDVGLTGIKDLRKLADEWLEEEEILKEDGYR